MRALFEGDGVRLVEEDKELYLYDGNVAYWVTSEWHNPDTYLKRGAETALVVYHGFSTEQIRALALNGGTTSPITGNEYDIASLCRLLLFGVRQKMGSVDIAHLEGMYAVLRMVDAGVVTPAKALDESQLGLKNPGVVTNMTHSKKVKMTPDGRYYIPVKQKMEAARELYGYRLRGTLRERIEQMIDLVSIGSYVKISDTRAFYREVGAPLHPKGEAFIKRYGFLFSSMSPSFANEDDDAEFHFEIFEELFDQDRFVALYKAGGEGSAMLQAVKAKAGCDVTPVGLYGCGDSATVYAGEDGHLYAIHESRPGVAVYDTLVDLLAVELKDHVPLTLED